MSRLCAALIASLLALPGMLAAGDVAYRWVDEHGVTHFSDRAPPEPVDAETVPLPEYAIPVTPTYSYVALLERLKALEEELEETRRERERPQTVVVPYPLQAPEPRVVRSVWPHPFLHRDIAPPIRQPVIRADDPRNNMSRFNRLFESRGGPSDRPDS